MRNLKVITIKILAISVFLTGLFGPVGQSLAQHVSHSSHQMQHGFVLTADDSFASHLVATGHHSRQTVITGQLFIEDEQELNFYEDRKMMNSSGYSYFLFQAQALNLPSLKAGQVLRGHIVESKIGSYNPGNVIVKKAIYRVEKILLNIANPFFKDM